MPPRRVTLTGDIGAAYAAQIVARFAREAPEVPLSVLAVDLTPHDVREASFLLPHMLRGFPPGTVHLAIVDPGVGGRRAPIALRTGSDQYLVGPDNGLFDDLVREVGVVDGVRLPPVPAGDRRGATFDGRDLFAPAAVRLGRGARLGSLGAPIAFRPGPSRGPARRAGRAEGTIRHIDRFGNLISDIPSEWAGTAGRVTLHLGAHRALRLPLVQVYDELAVGAAGVLPSSFGTLEVARRGAPFAEGGRSLSGAVVTLAWGRGPRREKA